MANDLNEKLLDAFDAENVDEVTRIVKAAAQTPAINYRRFLAVGATDALSYKNPRLIRALVEQEQSVVDLILPVDVTLDFSRDVLETLVNLGWDINKCDDAGSESMIPQETLLQLICDDDNLVHWCIEHGASTSDSVATVKDPHVNPPLLETVAGKGSVAIFEFLRSHGAKLGPRTLHKAVSAAAAARSDNPVKQDARMAMVKHLVEDLKLDVNAMDTDEPRHRHLGPPLCYAVSGSNAEPVVRYLLSHGADPTVKDCWGEQDAISLSEKAGNNAIADLLRGGGGGGT